MSVHQPLSASLSSFDSDSESSGLDDERFSFIALEADQEELLKAFYHYQSARRSDVEIVSNYKQFRMVDKFGEVFRVVAGGPSHF